MTVGGVALAVTGFALVLATTRAIVVLAPRRDRYMVSRVPQSDAPLLTARLIPAPRAIAGRPPAARTESQVHVITNAPWRTGARANEGGSSGGHHRR